MWKKLIGGTGIALTMTIITRMAFGTTNYPVLITTIIGCLILSTNGIGWGIFHEMLQ